MTTTAMEPVTVAEPIPTLLERDRRAAVARVPRLAPGWYLAVRDGEDVTVVALPEGGLHVGRSSGAQLSFDDPTVSRRHAIVVREGDEVRVLDDRSRNGVLLNGRPVAQAPLRHGDELGIGRQRIGVLRIT
jgi:hypothetical protein